MSAERNWTTVTVVWMGLAALALGAFWHAWNLVFGQIPVLTKVVWVTEKTDPDIEQPAQILTLPFDLSRSWDMLGAVLFVWIFCRFWRRAKAGKNEELVNEMVIELIGPLVGGLVFGLPFGLFFSLGVGLIVSMVGGPVFGVVYSFVVGLFWLGLVPGLAVLMLITAPFWLVAGALAAYRAVKNRPRVDWSGGVKSLLTGSNVNTEC